MWVEPVTAQEVNNFHLSHLAGPVELDSKQHQYMAATNAVKVVAAGIAFPIEPTLVGALLCEVGKDRDTVGQRDLCRMCSIRIERVVLRLGDGGFGISIHSNLGRVLH